MRQSGWGHVMHGAALGISHKLEHLKRRGREEALDASHYTHRTREMTLHGAVPELSRAIVVPHRPMTWKKRANKLLESLASSGVISQHTWFLCTLPLPNPLTTLALWHNRCLAQRKLRWFCGNSQRPTVTRPWQWPCGRKQSICALYMQRGM